MDKIEKWDYSLIFVIITELCAPHTLVGSIALLLFAIITIIEVRKYGPFRYNRILTYYIIFIIIAWLNIKFGYTINRPASQKLLYTLLICLVFSFLIVQYIKYTTKEQLCKVIYVAAVVSCACILFLTYVRTHSFVLRGGEEDNGINSNLCAVFSSFAILLRFCYSRCSKMDYFFFLFMLCFSALAGTRKAYIVLLMAWMIFTLLNKPSEIVRNLAVVGFVGSVALWAVMNIPFLYDNIGVRFETLFDMAQGGEGEASERARERFIEGGWYYILQKPWEGYGIDTFRSIFRLYSHNNYIEVLFSLGIPGLVAFYMMYIDVIIKAIVTRLLTKSASSALSIGLLCSTLFSHYAMVIYYSRVSFIMLFVMYAMSRNEEEEI